ncbi:MAG: ABZJ_00895 family protein [Gordonia sp. (in: high G+C Gram-positive bacteria)]|uniref:ABZJ_00895 family protein n=1 Tax=Gordonia sp. (in: high G+C Gram-positive bacteria) TaxID=84139 RepID=UPI0039E5A51F
MTDRPDDSAPLPPAPTSPGQGDGLPEGWAPMPPMPEPEPSFEPESGPLWRYLGVFTVASIGFSVVFALITMLFGGASSSVGFLVPFFAASVAIDSFVKRRRRVPESAEKWWLIWWSYGVTVVLNLISLSAFWFSEEAAAIDDGMGTVLLIVGAFAVVFAFAVVWAAYSFWPKRALRNRLRYEERQAAKRGRG